MIPVLQTITEPGKGNCLAACVASILEVPIEDVPDLKCGENWPGLVAFLESFGLCPVWLHCETLAKSYVSPGEWYCIACGESPRPPRKGHAVVAELCGYGFEIVHDPHPAGGGLASEIKSVILFVGLRPEKVA